MYGVFGGPAGIQSSPQGFFESLPEAKRYGRKLLKEDDDYFYEEMVVVEILVGVPFEPENLKVYKIKI